MIDITSIDNLLFMIPVAVIIALIFAVYFLLDLKKADKGTQEMRKISDAIETGAMAYLKRQYKTIGIISVIVAVIIALAGIPESTEKYLGIPVAVAFLIGAGFSILSGFIGMKVAVKTNIRSASAARTSLAGAFKIAFRGGAVSGIVVSTLSILGLFAVFLAYYSIYGVMAQTMHYIIGYAFGASFAALFAQLGGGIYTKAADVGADLVGKVEEGIPEDDPRNPAVIADLVGDNVGDCAGRGADIFESTAAEIIGSMVIGVAVLAITGFADQLNWVFLPMVIVAFGLIASIIGILTVRLKDTDKIVFSALNRGYYVTLALVLAGSLFSVYWLLKDVTNAAGESIWTYFAGCAIVGILLALAIVYITQYYTGDHKPVKDIAEASKTGPATNVIKGISVGLESTLLPVICIAIAICATFILGYYGAPDAGTAKLFGIYGTAIGTVAMLASSAFILAEDTYGPITDNAGGIVEMSNEPQEVRDRTDLLDASGNTTKALTKGYAMASAALASFLLFAAFFVIIADIKGPGHDLIGVMVVNFGNPLVFVGGLIGGVLVFYFASLTISAVGKAAGEMIEEVRRQFREDSGIMEGTSDPDYAKCVDIATRGALKQMILPALLPIIIPITFGLMFRYLLPGSMATEAPAAMGALMMVATIVGLLMANFLNNGGGAWDNAKKYIESGKFGGKGSPAHAAAVVGDTVGDPFKDTAGPSIHVLIKLLPTICMVTAVLYVI